MSTTQHAPSAPETRRAKTTLLIGFAALIVAVLAAYTSPARGAELSIYGATPLLFWAGVCLALLIGSLVAFRTSAARRIGHAAYLLSGAAVVSVVALPILRGYHFYGSGDSLSHLGWVRMFDAGTLHPANMRYPGIHSASVMLSKAAAIDETRAVLLVVLAFFLVFVLFVPLCVRGVTDTGPATVVGVASALLLLPINNIGVHVVAYPTTQAIMFVPVALYLVMAYVLDGGGRYELFGDVSAVGLLLALATGALILLHPQQALNLLGAFVLIAALQYAYREYGSDDHPIANHRPLYAQTGLFALLFLAWSLPKERVRVAIVDIATGLLSTGGGVGTTVTSRSVSLAVLGGSLEEMFVKLFGVSMLYIILASVLGLVVLSGSLSSVDGDGGALLQYLILTAIPGCVLFLVFLLANASDQYFRYMGFVMATVTIFGAVALAVGIDRLGGLRTRSVLSTVLGLAFVVLLVVQLAAFHPSPYIYQPNSQVSEVEMSGYDAVMEDRDEEIAFAGIRGGPRRYVDAYYGPDSTTAQEFPGSRSAVPEDRFNRGELPDHYDERRYVPVTEGDELRELALFDGFRYSAAGFDHLESSAEIDRVHANDEFALYLVDPDEE